MKDGNLIHKARKPHGITKASTEIQDKENLIKRDFTADKPVKKILTDKSLNLFFKISFEQINCGCTDNSAACVYKYIEQTAGAPGYKILMYFIRYCIEHA